MKEITKASASVGLLLAMVVLNLSENHEWPKEKSNFQVFNGLFQSHDYLLDYERTACT